MCATLDGIVRFYDIRAISVNSFESVVGSISNQTGNGLFACFGLTGHFEASSTSKSNIFKSLSTTPANKRITSVQYNNCGSEVIVSYQSDNIYLLDWRVITKNKIASIV